MRRRLIVTVDGGSRGNPGPAGYGAAVSDAVTGEVLAERAALAEGLPADLLALYERLRASEGGVGAGEISRGRCGGCHLDLMNNEKTDIRGAAPDEVLRHEECGRIMVRTAESGL